MLKTVAVLLIVSAMTVRAENAPEKPPAPPPGFGDDTPPPVPQQPIVQVPKKEPAPAKPAKKEPVGELNIQALKLDAVGTMPVADPKKQQSFSCIVEQVLDSDSMIVKLDWTSGYAVVGTKAVPKGSKATVCLKTSTKGIVDGAGYSCKGKVFKVTDTKTYQTVLGASKTVFVLEVVE